MPLHVESTHKQDVHAFTSIVRAAGLQIFENKAHIFVVIMYEILRFNLLVHVCYSLKGFSITEFFPLDGAGVLSFQMSNVKAIKSESDLGLCFK